jgi:osmotically-inducible protein OsmY
MCASFARRKLLPLVLLAALPVQGCVPVAIGAGALTGTTAAQERGIKGAVNDTGIRSQIAHYWLERDHELFMHLNLQVHEGRVLVSGAVKNADARAEAIQLAWKAQGVREIINEIQVTDEGGLGAYARDTAIVTELRSRILFAKEITSVNYSIEAVNGTVYLIGVAQNQGELDRVLDMARNITGVRRVVSHVLMKDDPRRFNPPPA